MHFIMLAFETTTFFFFFTTRLFWLNCRKINHQHKNVFIICNQLNEPVLKSLKPSCVGRTQKKNWPGRAEWKFYILFQAGPSSGLNFNFSFGSSRARTKISIFFLSLFQAGPRLEPWGPGTGLRNPVRADPWS